MKQCEAHREIRNHSAGYAVLGALLGVNLVAWLLAMSVYRNHPALLGSAWLAYFLGLRHAIDADHLVAIDNGTRKLMREGRETRWTGLHFSLGHSTVVMLATAAVAGAMSSFGRHLPALARVGGVIGTSISATVLLLIAIDNVRLAATARRRASADIAGEDGTSACTGGLARLLQPSFRLVRRSWHLYPVGVLFGLGFDTASEIALLAISAVQAAHGLPLMSIMCLPLLFTAGMTLVDTVDGLTMTRAYGWAMGDPARKFRYDMTLTLASAFAAVLVGLVEWAGLLNGHAPATGWEASTVAQVNAHFGVLGSAITSILLVLWGVCALHHRRCVALAVATGVDHR